jgi:16S rRNA (cytidine1402-2'-O)-methyltransferase
MYMLYIVPVPVGNLEDITLRGVRLFRQAQTIITEDSRQTRKLMKLLEIENKPRFIDITKNHTLNDKGIKDGLLQASIVESVVLLVTDSGTPGVSDPGCEIIRYALDNGIPYTVLPGATAFVPALVGSGLVEKEFTFLGFLPIKKGRQSTWKSIVSTLYPVVLYESVHRIGKWITEAQDYLEPERKLCISREISKTFETIWVGTVAELNEMKLVEKGEFVIVVDKMK